MRCPKCGYNSFDYLDSCKKCGKDLVEFKQRHGLKSILLPGALTATGAFAKEEFSDADAAELTGAAVAGTAAAGAAASTESEASPPDPAVEPADAVDFGFDFMGDSSDDDDDLSFDELFEDAPDDEDVEETLEAPKQKQQPAAVDSETEPSDLAAEVTASDDDFSFDLPDADDVQDEELENDFGFDPENLDLEPENLESEEPKKRQGTPEGSGEGPHDPFDLPESSQSVGAPVDEKSTVGDTSSSDAGDHPGDTVCRGDAREVSADDREIEISDNGPSPDRSVFLTAAPVLAAAEVATETTAIAGTATVPTPGLSPASAADPLLPSLINRCFAFCYDVAILFIAGLCFLVAGEMAQSNSSNFLPSADTLINLAIPYFLILFFLTFSYYTLFHFLAGQTPGEMLTGLRVETVEGAPLSLTQAFLRTVGGMVQLLPLGLGLLAVVARPDRRGWNDQFAGTRVVIAATPSLM